MTNAVEAATSTAQLSLTDFLLARIADDEAAALAAEGEVGIYPETWWGQAANWWSVPSFDLDGEDMDFLPSRLDADHIARHDPRRVLSECNVKSVLVRELEQTADLRQRHDRDHLLLRAMASVYAEHSDYQEEWTP